MQICTTLGFTVPLTVILSAVTLRGTEIEIQKSMNKMCNNLVRKFVVCVSIATVKLVGRSIGHP